MQQPRTIFNGRLPVAAIAAVFLFAAASLMQAQAGPETTLYHFSLDIGTSPKAGLIQGSDGNFYGTTNKGGVGSNNGTVFRITPAGALTVLHSFKSKPDGTQPAAGLIQGADGNFYGTTSTGGVNNTGTIFKMNPAGEVTVLYSFGEITGNDGHSPLAGLVQGSDGNFYGTTSTGGTNDHGTIFIVTRAGVLTILHRFIGADGSGPLASLLQASDGNFYGTTRVGGSLSGGTVFRITPAGEFASLHDFSPSDGDGAYPVGRLIQGGNGDLYGTCTIGGPYGNNGVVFEMALAGTLSILHAFDGYDGASPTDLIVARDGNFYGATSGGGPRNLGVVFELNQAGMARPLYTFQDNGDGYRPNAGLIQGRDGNFYGTTQIDTASGAGTVFRIDPANVVPPPAVNLAVAGNGQAQRGVGNAKVLFQRTGDTSLYLTVFYKVKGAAKAGVDFKPLTGQLVIPEGSAQAKLKIKPLNDPDNTGRRKLKIILLSPSDGSYAPGDSPQAKILVLGAE